MRAQKRTVKAANENLSTKELAAKGDHPSEMENPVEFVRNFLARRKNIERKKALAMLIAQGVNFHTAATQYAVFKKARGL